VREAEQRLQALRYRGETVAFEERNHLMESGWIPSNAAKGLVREATREIAGRDLRYLWRRAAPRDGLEREVALGYLPLDRALAHARDVPSGTLFFIARTWGHRVTDHVSHVGLLIRKDGQLFARHAASGRGRVIDQPFAQFLDAERRSFPAYPVVGLELVEPLETQTR
jgi:hypothetical protein